MRPVNWTRTARDDVGKIEGWLAENRTAEFAVGTLTMIRRRSEQLERFPESGRIEPHDTRVLVVYRTPFPILYRMEVQRIDLLRVRHQREDGQATRG